MRRGCSYVSLDETILEIEVRGKRGFGYCKSMPDAVSPFERLRSRLRPRRVEGVRAPTEVSDTSDVRGDEWRTPEPTDLSRNYAAGASIIWNPRLAALRLR
jgi:hypothetical protein